MSWEATGDSWSGGAPGREPGLPSRDSGFDHSGFDHGGPWAEAVPSAALAAALEQAAGPDDLYAGAETDALVGIARQWAAVESWAASGKLAALRAMTREDAEGRPLLRLQRRGPLPPLPPGQAAARLDRHPAQARMAHVDHPDRPQLHTGTLALHRLTARHLLSCAGPPGTEALPATGIERETASGARRMIR